jgi:hypothetical protein
MWRLVVELPEEEEEEVVEEDLFPSRLRKSVSLMFKWK